MKAAKEVAETKMAMNDKLNEQKLFVHVNLSHPILLL